MAKKGMEDVCDVCGDERHHDKIFLCKLFGGLKLHDKKGREEAWSIQEMHPEEFASRPL